MANALLTPTIIAREALLQLDNNLVFAKTVYRDYDREYRKVGDTITVRRPQNFSVTKSATASVQDVTEGSLTIQMSTQAHVAWKFSSKDLTLTVEEYSERYIKPAMTNLANQIDLDGLSLATSVNNWAGTPGQVVNSFADFAKGPQLLDELAVPQDDRYAMLSPSDYWGLVGSQTSLNSSDRLVETAYERARLGRVGGVELMMGQNVATFTTGARGGTPLVNGGSQTSTYDTVKATMTQTLNIDGATASVTGWAKAGDVFTIAGVFAVNPITGATLPNLQQFVVTADANSTAGGAVALTIYPAIIVSGPYKTASAAPADNAAITMIGSAATGYASNMVYHRNAFALVTAPLVLPDGAAFKAQETDPRTGVSVTVIKDFDFDNYEEKIRLDVLYGWKAIDPRLATRLSGTA